jgi:hypothetical protein
MDAQDIRLRAGGFDCEKVQKIFFFANAFSSIPQITPIQSAIQSLFQRFQIIIPERQPHHAGSGPLTASRLAEG